MRWGWIKKEFTKRYREYHPENAKTSPWQPRFWEHLIRDEDDFNYHCDYIHYNPVKHGLVHVATRYRWCSAAWLEQTASSATVRTIYGYEIDQVNVVDDY